MNPRAHDDDDDRSHPPRVSPQTKAAITLMGVVMLCGAFLYVRYDYAAVQPSAFRPEPKEFRRPPAALQLKIETEPMGALVTGPQGLQGVSPFLMNVPPDQDLPLHIVLPGHVTQDVVFHPKKAQVFRVVMQKTAVGAAPAVPMEPTAPVSPP